MRLALDIYIAGTRHPLMNRLNSISCSPCVFRATLMLHCDTRRRGVDEYGLPIPAAGVWKF
jgi:hypothetical protein